MAKWFAQPGRHPTPSCIKLQRLMLRLFMVEHLPKITPVNGLPAGKANVEMILLWHFDWFACFAVHEDAKDPRRFV